MRIIADYFQMIAALRIGNRAACQKGSAQQCPLAAIILPYMLLGQHGGIWFPYIFKRKAQFRKSKVARYKPEFGNDDLILGEYGATVVGLEIQRRKTMEIEEEARQKAVVQMAIGTLSYSEVEAVRQIFNELKGTEGLLVASKIADRSGITRSLIVNALRKLESAGVIETRSLGMKGTHIKILNNNFGEELSKVQM